MRYAMQCARGCSFARAVSRGVCTLHRVRRPPRVSVVAHTHAPGRVGMSFHRFGMTLSPSFTVFEFLT
jgi:hypothetical protein